jgi:hypothetical protein
MWDLWWTVWHWNQVFSQYFGGFACHSFIPLNAPQSSPSIIQGWYNKPIDGSSNSEPSSTPAPQTEEKYKKKTPKDILNMIRITEVNL